MRNATAFTDPTKVSVGLKFANAYTGDISIYALDYDKQGRAESISIDDGSGPRIYSLALRLQRRTVAHLPGDGRRGRYGDGLRDQHGERHRNHHPDGRHLRDHDR